MAKSQQPRSTLSIRVRERGEVTILELHGRLVEPTCAVLRECILERVARDRTKLMFDVSDLAYTDSAGLASILMVVSVTKGATSRLKFLDERGGENRLKDLLIPGWMGLVQWFEDEDAALQSFDQDSSGRSGVARW